MSQVDAELLKYLEPLRELHSAERKQLALQAEVKKISVADKLYARDYSRYFLYLLEGKLDLCIEHEDPCRITSDASRAQKPLFFENVLESYVLVSESCQMLFIEREHFHSLVSEMIVEVDAAASEGVSYIETNIYNEIIQAIESKQLKLPSLPEIALKVQAAILKEDVDVNKVARVAESDPAIVARLIQVANSPLTRGLEPVQSIRDAIVRLGLSMTKNLIVSFSVKQLFKTKQHILQERMKELYEHSVEISAISFSLSKKLNRTDADKMLLAGLIHDIGVIPVLTYIDETGLEIHSEKEVDSIVAKLRVAVGIMVVKNWDFPEEMISVVENSENWFRDTNEELDMTDIILVSQMYSMLQHNELHGLPEIAKVPVLKKIFPGEVDPQFVMDVLAQAQEEINEVKSLIGI